MSGGRPAPGNLPGIRFPEIESHTLRNGLTVLAVTDRRLPRIDIKLALPVGRTWNPPENGSLIDLTFELLKEGAGSRSAEQVASLMDRWALDYESSPMMEQSIVSVSALSAHSGVAMECLSDVVLRPALADEELDRLKTRLRSQLKAQRSSADFLASERLFSSYFGAGHPCSRLSFSVAEMEGIDAGSIRDCWARVAGPAASLLLMAGDIDLDEAVELARNHFGDWKCDNRISPDPPPVRPDKRIVLIVSRPHSRQARLVLGLPGLARSHPEWNCFRLMNRVLGGGGSARLFLNLREDKGFTYGIYSYLRGYRTNGLQITATDLNSDVVGQALDEIFREMELLKEEPAAKAELERARSELVGALLRRLETPGSVGALELSRRLFELDTDCYNNYVGELNALTTTDIRSMAQRMLLPERATIVAVGDLDVLRPQLEPFGSITGYDHEGNLIATEN